VLVNAGSTITEEDIATIHALYESGIPASILLSKADLLSRQDRASACAYIADQIRRELGLELPVQPVSVVKEHAALLDAWFDRELAPLYERHQQLASESVQRKIGALRDAVEAALRSRLDRENLPAADLERLKEVEMDLRSVAGEIPEVLSRSLHVSDRARDLGPQALAQAACGLVEYWERNGSGPSSEIIAAAITRTVAAEADRVYADLSKLCQHLSDALDRAAAALNVNDVPGEMQFAAALKEMPRVDAGTVSVEIRRPFFLRFGPAVARPVVERQLRNGIGHLVVETCRSYGRLFEAWIRRAVAEIKAGFDLHADGYRAQLERLLASSETAPETQTAIARDLVELKESREVEVR
jgi:hypothetical protein